MPKRNSTFRVASTALQGEDSFVVFKKLSWGAYQQVMAKLDAAPRDAQGNPQLKFLDTDEHLREVLRESVVDWNWVDDAGAPLPTPANGLEIAALNGDEVGFLYQAAVNPVGLKGQATEKN